MGFDHHCCWGNNCVGRKNYKQFVLFNITWLLYLIYAIVWVSVAGPLISSQIHHHNNHPSKEPEPLDVNGTDTP